MHTVNSFHQAFRSRAEHTARNTNPEKVSQNSERLSTPQPPEQRFQITPFFEMKRGRGGRENRERVEELINRSGRARQEIETYFKVS